MGLGYPLSPKSRTSDIIDSFWLWVETLGTVIQPNANRRQSRKIGRRILLFIFLLNMFIFASNVFWLRRDLMKEEDESLTKLSLERARKLAFSSSSSGTLNDESIQKRAQRAIYERREGIYDPAKQTQQQRAIISVRSFDIDPISGEFVPKKEIRKQPDKYFVTHPVLVSGVCSKTLPSVRELVGSLHFWHPEVVVWLYEVGPLLESEKDEVAHWRNVYAKRGVDALQYALLDERLDLGSGALGKVQREVRTRTRQGVFESGTLPTFALAEIERLMLTQTFEDEPDFEEEVDENGFPINGGEKDKVRTRSSVLKRNVGEIDILPSLIWHAVNKNGNALFVHHNAHARGWIDNVLKALSRDKRFFVQEETTRGGCNPNVQGYFRFNNATEEILKMHVQCSLGGACPRANTLVGEEKSALSPGEVPEFHNWFGTRPDLHGFICIDSKASKISTVESLKQLADEGDEVAKIMLKEQYHCRVRHKREPPEIVFETKVREQSFGNDMARDKFKAVHVVLGVPSSTLNTKLVNSDALPLVNVLLPSILGTIDKSGKRTRYTLLVGFEQGDIVYDSAPKMKRLQKRMQVLIGDYPVTIKVVRFHVSLSTTYVWNGLFDRAIDVEKCDYFMTVHDDSEFYPSQGQYWADILINSLLNNNLAKNFGVASPEDVRDARKITHAFVHRTHRDVFGALYPEQLSNEEHAIWISRVYGYKNTFLHPEVQVYNSGRFSGRSLKCVTREEIVNHEVYMSADLVKTWAMENLGAYSEHLHNDLEGIGASSIVGNG